MISSKSVPVGQSARVRAGFVRRSHGLRGELRVEPLGGDASRFTIGMRLHIEGRDQDVVVAAARPAAKGDVLLRFEGIGDRTAADSLHGVYLAVDFGEARRLAPDEWFVDQLIGLRAITPEGAEVGRVSDVEHYAAQDVLVVDEPRGLRRYPFVSAFVTAVDVAGGTVTIAPWEDA